MHLDSLIKTVAAQLISFNDPEAAAKYIYDKIEETYDNLGIECTQHLEAQHCVDSSDLVVIMHPDKDFANLNFDNVEIIDLWGIKEK